MLSQPFADKMTARRRFWDLAILRRFAPGRINEIFHNGV